MAIASVGGNEIWYEVSGDGPGLPVVLIMGLATDANSWQRQVPELGRSRRVLVLDNRGVGRSGKPPGPYTTAALAGDALAVMDAAGIGEAHIVGISLGGAIAQELVLAAPERVRSLVLMATFAAQDAEMQRTADAGSAAAVKPGFDVGAALRGLAEGKVELDPRAMIGFLMPLVFSKKFLEEEKAFLKGLWDQALAHGVSVKGFAGQVAAAMAHDTRARLATIRVPTLVVTGDKDRLVPARHSRALAAAIPGAKLVEIPGGTHGLPLELADEVNRILVDWLRTHDA